MGDGDCQMGWMDGSFCLCEYVSNVCASGFMGVCHGRVFYKAERDRNVPCVVGEVACLSVVACTYLYAMVFGREGTHMGTVRREGWLSNQPCS